MNQAEEILALQVAEDPDFPAKREVLWAAVVEAQSKIKICPEYDQLVADLVAANKAFRDLGIKWVAHVHCGHATKAAELALANMQARDDLKSERHREVSRESMRRARDKPNG